MATDQVRPTKKQRELLSFIEAFIAEHGYSPSYREIMTGLQYNSVATVALHVNSLIKRGHLLRRDGKARSLEVAHPTVADRTISAKVIDASDEKWLIQKVEYLFGAHEGASELTKEGLDELHVLVKALKVLGFDGAAQGFADRLRDLQARDNNTPDQQIQNNQA
jgi:repressor LexA